MKLYESCISAHCPNNSCMFFSSCLPSSSFFFPHLSFFSYLVAPLSVLSFQEAKTFRSWSPYKIFKPLFLIHLKPLLSTFSLYFLCKDFLAVSHNFQLKAFILWFFPASTLPCHRWLFEKRKFWEFLRCSCA